MFIMFAVHYCSSGHVPDVSRHQVDCVVVCGDRNAGLVWTASLIVTIFRYV